MTKIIKPIGDGKRKILSLDEAMAQIDAHQPGVNGVNAETQPEQQVGDVPYISYRNLEWELAAPVLGSNIKILYSYEKSLARLRDAGYERHPRPWEVFSLLIDYTKGRLGDDVFLKSVAADILRNNGEWLSLAMKIIDGQLFCYVDPETLIPWEKSVAERKFNYLTHKRFDVTGIRTQNWIELGEFSIGLVRFLYGKAINETIGIAKDQEAFRNSKIWLPGEEELRPVGRKDSTHVYKFFIGADTFTRASRGVREKK